MRDKSIPFLRAQGGHLWEDFFTTDFRGKLARFYDLFRGTGEREREGKPSIFLLLFPYTWG